MKVDAFQHRAAGKSWLLLLLMQIPGLPSVFSRQERMAYITGTALTEEKRELT